ncbi:MAG: peptide-methionine (R)-S-oxide reductase MsrB [Gammaproteobacteria bacterium]|nr:peptide-methionine (R)-S-oxide reductase MsrB [Gammaproteobacteria bacterium]
MTDKLSKSAEEWRCLLSPEQYYITREAGTERPFSGEYCDHTARGSYHCICCGTALFSSASKFDSGSGWPSFWQAVPAAVATREDLSHGMRRTEIRCARCDAHLGHQFSDGPPPSGLRYCVNSAALSFSADAEA